MGYYISVLQKGEIYELNGQKLEFDEKAGKLYFFYVCEFDEESFSYRKTDETAFFTLEEINYIKRYNEQQKISGLKKIGKDKVFQRY
jgi:hypothetical protein